MVFLYHIIKNVFIINFIRGTFLLFYLTLLTLYPTYALPPPLIDDALATFFLTTFFWGPPVPFSTLDVV